MAPNTTKKVKYIPTCSKCNIKMNFHSTTFRDENPYSMLMNGYKGKIKVVTYKCPNKCGSPARAIVEKVVRGIKNDDDFIPWKP